jgi:hypothetical protein
MDESQVDLLPLLHKDLYGELKYAIVFPRIKIYTNLSRIFRDKECKAVTRSIATKAAEVLHVLKDEEVFTMHEVARGMYFLNSGLFDFTSADGTTFEITPDVRTRPEDGFVVHWLAEFALSQHWVHKDGLYARSRAELVVVSRVPLFECLEGVPDIKERLVEEQKKRYERISNRCGGDFGDWTEHDKAAEEGNIDEQGVFKRSKFSRAGTQFMRHESFR